MPFVPYDEDYGYITIEAMLSSKPVVTTLDAGGPTEFVVDGETGRVVAPEAKALGQALDALVADPAVARRMGQNAAAKVAGISWAAVEHALLGSSSSQPKLPPTSPALRRSRQRITGFSTFPVSPARGGGQQRVGERAHECRVDRGRRRSRFTTHRRRRQLWCGAATRPKSFVRATGRHGRATQPMIRERQVSQKSLDDL